MRVRKLYFDGREKEAVALVGAANKLLFSPFQDERELLIWSEIEI